MKRKAVLAFLFLIAAGWFGMAIAKADPDDDQAFIETTQYYGIAPTYSNYAKIAEAHGVCRAFTAGAQTTDVVYAVAADLAESTSHAAYFVGASTAAYCPWNNVENRKHYGPQRST